MQNKRLKICVLFLFGIGLTGLRAQNAIPACGGNASGSGGSASYSIGQVVYTTDSGTNGSVAQGVQQPYEISVVTEIEQATGINLSCSAYPNPTSEFISLKTEGYDVKNLSYLLYDINGKLIQTKTIEASETIIVMSNLKPATYFLKINSENKEIKTFKIIKN